jgi:dTMP kinase
MKPLKRGLFIVFEGLDHSGKTTQSKLLFEYIKAKNEPVKHIAFPGN